MTAPLIALSVPLLDTSLSVARRFLTAKPLFAADRGHIHHRLLDRGLTHRRVALVFYGLCSVAAVFSLIMSSQHFERLVIFVFCALAWLGIARLGYVEFRVAGRMFMKGAFRRHLSSEILLQQYEHNLRSAATPQQCWTVIESACRELGFQKVRLMVRGQKFEYEVDRTTEQCWEMHVPLSETDYIDLSRPFGEALHVNAIAPFADLMRRILSENLSATAEPERKGRYRVVAHHS
jgi:UDP-GlcNAc:undecaprenyl-phosphate GlcNAc-1-phosphate transferase